MLILKMTFKGKCEIHPRYDPATEGEGGIKGGCKRCYQLLAVWKSACEWRKVGDSFQHNPVDVPVTAPAGS